MTHRTHYDESQIEGLPAPVQRYFKKVLRSGQRIVAAVSVQHQGTFNMAKGLEKWRPFASTQQIMTCRPGFDWDARISIMPGISAWVHDAYIAGEGILHASILGLVPMADLQGTGETARGELMRFFSETVWYPTALLPSQGVTWEPVNSHSARATMKDGAITLNLKFQFNDEGLIDTVSAEDRGRIAEGKIVLAPWQARMWDYEIREGMLVPMEGEASWMNNGVPEPYWRGRITGLQYEFFRAKTALTPSRMSC